MSRRLRLAQNARGFYPERNTPPQAALDRALMSAVGQLGRLRRVGSSRFPTIVRATDRFGRPLKGMSDEELVWQVKAMRPELRARGFTLELVAQIFALVRELADRRLGQRPFEAQLMAGWVLISGMMAEMVAGEGKTLAATLPACTVALAGIPVHIITVNDYLARRDASWMAPVYEGMGLSVGTIVPGMGLEERRRAYRCDVTYCTNKEITFDYLRDRLELGRRPGPIRLRLARLSGPDARYNRLRLRGLFYAIVDEADSVLIDEARTPLIISGTGDNTYEAEVYRQALELADRLESGTDFYIDFAKRNVVMTDGAKAHLAEVGQSLGGLWKGRLRREELVHKALTARHLFHRDKHYVIKDDTVQIVDEYTGRVMPGRSWEGGLHQLIETKEQCEVTAETEVLARISYQRFFRRYLALAGMTGTAKEAARELWSVYRLEVVAIPTHKPMIRRSLPHRIFSTAKEKWAAVVARIRELHMAGRPVLVGTRTVADSEQIARLLKAADLPCQVLNAKQDEQEAEIIAQAGRRGQITVATNMAGRGTDIKLPPEVRELGGLHVIATERHDAGRIDRQLFGRCGRQGDPGTYELFVSLEDELLRAHPLRILTLLKPGSIRRRSPLGRLMGQALFNRAQRAAEREHYRIRRDLMRLDESIETALAFSGSRE